MHNNFSFKRWRQLVKKQWVENGRMYITSVLALMGILSISFGLWIVTSDTNFREDTIYGIGLFTLFITGGVFASIYFNAFYKKDTGIYWITFPASRLEKFLTAFVFNIIIFPFIYFCCFELLKLLAEFYIHVLIVNKPKVYSYSKTEWSGKYAFGKDIPNFIYGFFAVQAAFLVGGVSFKKFSFLFTTLTIVAITFVSIIYLMNVSNVLLPNGYKFNLTKVSNDIGNNIYRNYTMNIYLEKFIEIFLKFILTPFLWLVTWFKLKEKQV